MESSDKKAIEQKFSDDVTVPEPVYSGPKGREAFLEVLGLNSATGIGHV